MTATVALALAGAALAPSAAAAGELTQTGSSTVLPLATVWAEEFEGAGVSVSGGGSSHGLNALLQGEADLADASRLLQPEDYEDVGCDGDAVTANGTATAPCNGVLPTKWVVAYDMLAVVVHPENDWATNLNYEQLSAIFTDNGTATHWDEVPGLEDAPHEEIVIHAPDKASGTYDYFFEEITPDWGNENQPVLSRLAAGDPAYHPSADDNVLLRGVASDPHAIGFFGYAYVAENQDLVQAVSVSESATGPVEPSFDTVEDYPLARPLHVYTDGVPGEDSAVHDYVEYMLSEDGQAIAPEVGYVQLDLVDADLAAEQLERL